MDQLAKLAAALQRDVARADKSRAELHAVILAALENGTSQADVARATGYTRERLRQISAAKRRK